MLKKQASRTRVRSSSGDDVLEPEAFWTLIEKLLLRSTSDVQVRNQHNLAISTLCRGHAVPSLPRKQIKASKSETSRGKVTKANSKRVDKGRYSTPTVLRTKPPSITADHSTGSLTSGIRNAAKAQSECLINDLDVVYVPDRSKIPASERLWRYAMKQNKEKTIENNERKASSDCVPNARSNDAIYHAIKQRLDEAISETQTEAPNASKKKPLKRLRELKVLPRTCTSLGRNDIKKVKVTLPFTESASLSENPVKKEQQMRPNRHEKGQLLSKRHKEVQNFPFEMNNKQPYKFSRGVNNKPHIPNIDGTNLNHDNIDNRKTLYDCVLKKRLSCGDHLETLNKEIVYKNHNPRSILNRETTKKYTEIKNEYLSLCYQECQLRQQIGILHAEIYKMHDKGYQKRPASIKTINLDSNSTNIKTELDKIETQAHSHRNSKESRDVLLFPRLKAPKPLLVSQQSRDRSCDTRSKTDCMLPYIMDGYPSAKVCSVYCLSQQLALPPKRTPIMTVDAKISRDRSLTKLSHRLPKMSTINLLKAANKN